MARTGTRVLVVEFDDAVRGSLCDALTLVGDYAVAWVVAEEDALAYLAAQPKGMVVLVGNKVPDHQRCVDFFAAVAADEGLSQRHRYIQLSTAPARLPDALRIYLKRLNAPVVAKPFDLDVLLITVREAAARLAPARVPVWRR